MNTHKGFTIVELLVVMAIIGILASIILASLSYVQSKSRDTRRIEDLSALQNALALYQAGSYRFPIAASAVTITGADSVSEALITAGAISGLAGDPLSPEYDYAYQSNALGTDYTITFCLETDSIPKYAQGCGNEMTP